MIWRHFIFHLKRSLSFHFSLCCQRNVWPRKYYNTKDKSIYNFHFPLKSAEIFVFQCPRQTDGLHTVCREALQGPGGRRSVLPGGHQRVREAGLELGVPGHQWRPRLVSEEPPPSQGRLPQPQLTVGRPRRQWLHPPHSDKSLHLRLWKFCILGRRPSRRPDHRCRWL